MLIQTPDDLKIARKEVQAARVLLRPTQVAWRSGRAVGLFYKNIHKFGFKKDPLKIALYKSLPGELKLARVERQSSGQKVQLFYPKIVDPKSCRLEFFAACSPLAWSRGHFGVLEPEPHLADAQLVPQRLEPDLFLVPGVLFGRGGERVGWGKGYYDRYLAQFPNVPRIGFCFEFQLFKYLPQQPTDQSMDWIVTDQEVVECSARAKRRIRT